MAKNRRPAMMSGHEFYVRRQAVGLDLQTFSKANDVTISVVSKLQTERAPVTRQVSNYLQSVEDDVEHRVILEYERLSDIVPDVLAETAIITDPPEDWKHGHGTWQVVAARVRHMLSTTLGVSPPLAARQDPAAS